MEENSPVPFDQMSNDRIGYLWAKWKIDEDGTLTYHPLICHMIDSSCVVECMWREGLPKAWKERLADELDLDQLVTQQWLMLMAGWHDIGKASPGFQTQLYGKSLDAARKLLRAAGLPDTYRPWVPHPLVSALALKDYYAQAQPNTDEIIKIAMSIIGGHHGS